MDVAEAFGMISKAIDAGRPANGYLVCGDLHGQCDALAARVLKKLFPDAADQIESRCHPDVAWISPQGASRTIKVERGKSDAGPGIRDGIVAPMSATSFSGGWKVGVIEGADRMNENAANAFLKILEEPPPKTMFLLLTESTDGMLPTIVSRCQRIDLPLSDGTLEGDAYDAVVEVMESKIGDGPFARMMAASRLAEILGDLRDEAKREGGADFAWRRRAFYRTIMKPVRRWMVEGLVPVHLAFRNVEAVEAAARQSEKSIGDEAVLGLMMDRMAFP